MPAQQLKSFAEKSGKSLKEVEKLWEQAKAIAKKEYADAKDDKFYAIVTGILKNSLGLKEETFLDMVDSEMSNLSEMCGKKHMKEEDDMDKDDEDEEVDEEGKKKKKKKSDKDMDKDDEDEEVDDEEEKK